MPPLGAPGSGACWAEGSGPGGGLRRSPAEEGGRRRYAGAFFARPGTALGLGDGSPPTAAKDRWPHDAPAQWRSGRVWGAGGGVPVEISNSGAGNRRPEPGEVVPGQDLALLPIAEVLARQDAGAVLL